MKRIILASLLVTLMAACTPATPDPEAIETAIAQTQAAQPQPTATPLPTNTSVPTNTPTLTPTPIRLSEIDLESIIVMEGDLPAGYSAAQIRSDLPGMFDDIPKTANSIYQQLEKNGEGVGGISVMIYNDISDVDKAFIIIKLGMRDGLKPVQELGSEAQIASIDMSISGMKIQMIDLLFMRCHAVVHLRMMETANEDYAISYAERLDKRLTPLVCIE